MPTTLPRLQVTMPQPLYDTVSELAELTNQSKARVLLDVLEPAQPIFQEIVDLIRAQNAIKESPIQHLQASLDVLRERILVQPGLPPRVQHLLRELARELGEPTPPVM